MKPMVLALVLFPVLLSSPLHAQCETYEAQELAPGDSRDFDYFGESVSLSGNHALVGAWVRDRDPAGGSAFLYRQDGPGLPFQRMQEITASDGHTLNEFGRAVFLGAERALIGAIDDAGSVGGATYVYRFSDGLLVEEAKLAPDLEPDAAFGWSLDLDDDVAIIGAPQSNEYGQWSGSAFIYRRSGESWVLEQKLLADDGAAVNWFGWEVAIEGNLAVVGAMGHTGPALASGAVYLFEWNGLSWVQQQKLVASDADEVDRFGEALALDGDTLLIGSPFDKDQGFASGSAYVFRNRGGQWEETAKLLSSDGREWQNLGRSVALDKNVAILGARGDDDPEGLTGAAFVFRFNGTHWLEVEKLKSSNGSGSDYFGHDVALDGENILIGAWGHDGRGLEAGSAYVFAVRPLVLDANPETVFPGDELVLTTCGGFPGNPVLLSLIEINGLPLFTPLLISNFDGSGRFSFAERILPNTSNLDLSLQSFGILEDGKIVSSSVARVLIP